MAKVKGATLQVGALSLAVGVAWGIGCLIAGWTSMFGWGNLFVETMASIYIGYTASFIGGIIGGIWGFFDGLLFGFLLSVFYNIFRK
jgi:hypothetical protein